MSEIHEAVKSGNLEKVKALLKDQHVLLSTTDDQGHTPLHVAAEIGQTDCVQVLMAAGADVNSYGDFYKAEENRPLHLAAKNGRLDCVKALIAAGAAVDKKNKDRKRAITLAASRGHTDCVRALIDSGADVNAGDYTALMSAADIGSVDCVKALVAAGADVNAKEDWRWWTALDSAVFAGHTDCLKALISLGADINSRRKNGFTPLMQAAWRGKDDCVKALIAAGANVNILVSEGTNPHMKVDDWGTALIGAAFYCGADSVKALIAAGADVNVRGRPGDEHPFMTHSTALMLAAAKGQADSVNALIAAGADVNAKDDHGETALKYAENHPEIIAILKHKSDSQLSDSSIAWESYDYLDASDRKSVELAIAGEPNPSELSSVLIKIGTHSAFTEYEAREKKRHLCPDHFDKQRRNKLSIIIGNALSKKGGIELMQLVAKSLPIFSADDLSRSWNGVDGWLD